MKKNMFSTLLLSVAAVLPAALCLGSDMTGWQVIAGGAKPVAATFTPTGACVRIDRAKAAKPNVNWIGFAPVKGKEPVVTEDAKVVIVCRYPAQGLIRTPGSLRLEDAQGEVFRYMPMRTRRDGERVTVTYAIHSFGWHDGFFAGRPHKGATEGRNRNDAFDAPVRIISVAFGLRPEVAAGALIVESIDILGGVKASAATELIRAPVMCLLPDEDRFVGGKNCSVTTAGGRTRIMATGRNAYVRLSRPPGMKPFPAAEDIILRTSRSYGGSVRIDLKDPKTERIFRIKAPWQDETHFATNALPNCAWQLLSLEFYPKPVAKGVFPKIDFTLDAIEGVYRTSAAGACRLDVDTGNGLHVVRNASERPTLTLRNLASRTQNWKGTLRCRDYFGQGFDLPVAACVRPGETALMPLNRPLSKGLWRVFGEIVAADGSTAYPETRFAVLDAHPHTPRLPRGRVFRPGINWHAGGFSPADRHLCEEALDACGCKLVRAGGFTFGGIESQQGVRNWILSDAIMEETERHGISIDAIVYSPPRWSQDTNRIARLRHFKKGMVPSRTGTFGAFAESIATRYGTKIDYYEIGNEWDLVPESIMTRDEAVRIHREGYDAIKRACPAATVMPNGWTSPDVRPDHYSKDPEDRVGGDYQAYVMTRIRDASDIYPVHMHGDYRSYHRRVRRFLDLRRRIGCGNIPWFANETACSSVNGQEDDVARYVFQKIMCSWANGSVDYIWYNLKATGWVESDSEQGYGMMTADFYPRASYAAFSAFTAVYLGRTFTKTEIDRGTRMVCRFAGGANHKDEIVFGGWDDAAVKPCPIRVKTDAAKAECIDLMGNRTPLAITNGEVVWPLGANPSSVVLSGATVAALNATDLATIPLPPQAVLTIASADIGRAPDARLNAARQRIDFHQAIPETRHRVWQGPKDSSADIWFDRVGDDIRLRVAVTDDVRAQGDGVRASVGIPGRPPKAVDVPCVGEKDGKRQYECILRAAAFGFDEKVLHEGLDIDVRVTDDDGEGEDGYAALSVEIESPVRIKFAR